MRLVFPLVVLSALTACQVSTSQGMGGMVFHTSTPVGGDAASQDTASQDEAAEDETAGNEAADDAPAEDEGGGGAALTIGGGFGTGVSN